MCVLKASTIFVVTETTAAKKLMDNFVTFLGSKCMKNGGFEPLQARQALKMNEKPKM